MQTGLAAWGFFLQARMKEVECSRYRQGYARDGWAVIGKDGLLRVRSCDSNAAVLCAAVVAAHASASQRADRPPSNSACRAFGHPSSKAEYRRVRVGISATSGAVWTL